MEGDRSVGIGGNVAADVIAVDFDWVIGAGVGERVESAGVPITFKIGSVSDSPVCGQEDELDWKEGSMRVFSGPELADFASNCHHSRERDSIHGRRRPGRARFWTGRDGLWPPPPGTPVR